MNSHEEPPEPPEARRQRPSLMALFLCFLHIGSISFGSGMPAWIRRETVQRRPWIDEHTFVSGLALAQIAPGPNGVNMAVFVGTELHGAIGALVAFAGIMTVPVVVLLTAGALYMRMGALPEGSAFDRALGGMGAAAIGLTFANGFMLTPRNVRGVSGWGVMLATILLVAAFRMPLIWALLVMLTVSLLLAWYRPRTKDKSR